MLSFTQQPTQAYPGQLVHHKEFNNTMTDDKKYHPPWIPKSKMYRDLELSVSVSLHFHTRSTWMILFCFLVSREVGQDYVVDFIGI